MAKTVRMDFQTSPYIKQTLKHYADKRGKRMTTIINDLLYKWIQEQRKKDE